MKRLMIIALMLLVFVIVAAPASAAPAATRVTLTGPASVRLGEEIGLEVRLLTAEGAPIAGTRLELRQVGAVGERVITTGTTDAQGTAYLGHREYTVPQLTLRVAFRGTAVYSASHADISVTVTGIEAAPSVVMSHSPATSIKIPLFLVLATVWLTYVYAASRAVRVALEARRIPQGGRSR